MKTWRIGVLGTLSLAVAGCGDPTGIGPAAPPGVSLNRPLPATEAEDAQAIGEQAVKEGFDLATMKADAAKIPLAEPTARGEVKTTTTGVKYETLQEGTGPQARGGQTVMVHLTAMLPDGKVFESSRSIDQAPRSFIIGITPVVKGLWDGVAGMRVGERRKLIIPPERAYGAIGKTPTIPPKATLTYDVELLSVK
jgi:FKBP-type peptidyl-prolyl cis-trans isomerase